MADAPPSVLRVIRASREITPSETLLAGEYYCLDRGHRGCYAREDVMARRVALRIRSMKACRIRLKELGIIASAAAEEDRRRQTIYFTLPDCYHPSEFAKDEEVFRLAEMLDDDIRSGRRQERVGADRRATEAIDVGNGERGVTQSVGEIVKGLVQPTAPISEQRVQPTAQVPGELGAISCKNGCSPTSESVRFARELGAVSCTPIESVLDKNAIERISTERNTRTEGSQSDVPQENGSSIKPDPSTKPQTQAQACPHPHGSPEWKTWQLSRLKATEVA